MAETYKSQGTKLTTTANTTILTAVAAATTAVVNGIFISNVNAAASTTINVFLVKSAVSYSIISNVSINAGTTLQVLDSPIVVETGDSITATAATASYFEIIVPYLNIT